MTNQDQNSFRRMCEGINEEWRRGERWRQCWVAQWSVSGGASYMEGGDQC